MPIEVVRFVNRLKLLSSSSFVHSSPGSLWGMRNLSGARDALLVALSRVGEHLLSVFFVVKCRRRKPKSFFKFFQSRAVFFRADDVLLRFSHFPCSAQGSVPRHGVALLFCLKLGGVRPFRAALLSRGGKTRTRARLCAPWPPPPPRLEAR